MIMPAVLKYVYILVRISGLFVFAPFFSSKIIPVYIKAGLVATLAYIVSQSVPITIEPVDDVVTFSLIIAKEFIVGMALGLVSEMLFDALYVAGEIMDLELGFGMVNVFDPFTQAPRPLMGNFVFYLSLMVYLVVNGHHRLIEAVVTSYKFVPVNGMTVSGSMIKKLVEVFGEMFVLGIKISAPVLIAIFLTDVSLALLSRAVPQLNVFINGMPVKILIGFGVVMLMLPMFLVLLDVLFNSIDYNNLQMMRLMR